MQIVYYSLTGNVRRFIQRTDAIHTIELTEETNELEMYEPFILVTGTIGFGEVPEVVDTFLNYGQNSTFLKGVVGSGNRNWGQNFAKASKTLSGKYNVPLLHTFELHGNDKDIEIFNQKVANLV